MSSLNITGNNQQAPENDTRHHHEDHTAQRESAPGRDPSRNRETTGEVNLLHLIQTSHVPVASKEVKEFVERTTATLTEQMQGARVTMTPDISVPSVYVVRAWIGEAEYAYLVGFTSLMSKVESPYTPASSKLSIVSDILTRNNSNVTITGLLLLTASDIDIKPDVAIARIKQALDQAMNPSKYALTLRSLTTDTTLDVLSSDVELVRNWIRGYNPSTVDPRIDMGFVTSVKVPQDIYNQLSEADRAIVDYNNLTENSMPVSAVGGYVEFLGPMESVDARGNKITQFVPNIHITAQAMLIDSPLFTLMNLLTINQVWAENGGWMDYFLNQGPNGVNIANLVSGDEEGTVNDMPAEEFLRRYSSYFADPIVTFDVGIGRYGSNFLFHLAGSGDENLRHVVTEVEKALNDNHGDFGRDLEGMREFRTVSVSAGRQFQGFIKLRNKLVDSRTIDYLTQVKTGEMDKDQAEELLDLNDDPVRRLEVLEKLFDGPAYYESMYDTDVIVITPEFIMALTTAFERLRVKIYDRDAGRRRRNIGGLSSASSLAGFGLGNVGTNRLFSGSNRNGRRTLGDGWSTPFRSR